MSVQSRRPSEKRTERKPEQPGWQLVVAEQSKQCCQRTEWKGSWERLGVRWEQFYSLKCPLRWGWDCHVFRSVLFTAVSAVLWLWILEVDALSRVHVTQSVCRPTTAPVEQCDLYLTSAQCGQTDQPLGDMAKTVSYHSRLQPRKHLSCRKSKSGPSQITHISPKDWRLPDFPSLHPSLWLFDFWKPWSN